jgi:hypothetical protein
MIKIAKYDLEGNFLEILEGEKFNHIAVTEGVDHTVLKRAVNNLVMSCNGFQYRPVDVNVHTPVKIAAVWHLAKTSKYRKHIGIIGKYYKNKLISTYESLSDLSERNNIFDFTNISRQLVRGKAVSKNGFTFKKIV